MRKIKRWQGLKQLYFTIKDLRLNSLFLLDIVCIIDFRGYKLYIPCSLMNFLFQSRIGLIS